MAMAWAGLLAEAEQTDAKIRMTQGEGLINRRLGDLDRLFPAGMPSANSPSSARLQSR